MKKFQSKTTVTMSFTSVNDCRNGIYKLNGWLLSLEKQETQSGTCEIKFRFKA